MVDYGINYTSLLLFNNRKLSEKLYKELGWETIQKRINYLGLSIFHKIHVGETRPLLRKCLTKIDWERTHYLRSKGGYVPYPNY